MRRIVLVIAALIAVSILVLLLTGGLWIKAEAQYVETPAHSGERFEVFIQSSRVWGFGPGRFVGLSEYGPPFDLFITGELPAGTVGTAEVADLVVEADGVALLTVARARMGLVDATVYRAGTITRMKGYRFAFPAISAALNPQIKVSGFLMLPDQPEPEKFERVFELRRKREVTLGPWSN